MTPIRVIFLPAAGEGIGGGHVMRCMALAQALTARGAECGFAVNPIGQTILRRFGDRAWPVWPVDTAADVLVLDDYALAAGHEARMKERVRLLVVVDDLADRPHLADILVDPGDGRMPQDYAGLVPDEAQVLTGSSYALIRAAFAEARAKRPVTVKPEIERIFISFGLSDVGGVTARATALLSALAPDTAIDIVLPSSSDSLNRIAAMIPSRPGLTLHLDATNVADLLSNADVAVGAGGASTWERCCLGVPSIAVVVAENQRELVAQLADSGVLLGLPPNLLIPGGREARGAETFEDGLGAAFLKLRDAGLRQRLADASFAACDGLGARRVAEAVLDQVSRMRSRAGS